MKKVEVKIVALVVFVTVVSLAQVVLMPIATVQATSNETEWWGGQRWYAPDWGQFRLTTRRAHSTFRWDEEPPFGWTDTYEHEFHVKNQAFAKYGGRWSSNLPSAALDVDNNLPDQANDEFSVTSRRPDLIEANRTYWMNITLSPEGASQSILQLEAEYINWLGFGIPPWRLYFDVLAIVTAPDDGGWTPDMNIPLSQNLSDRGRVLNLQKNRFENTVQEEQMPLIETEIQFVQPLTLAEVDQLIARHKIRPFAIRYRANDGSFTGGFDFKYNIHTSLYKAIRGLKGDLALVRKEIKQEPNNQILAHILYTQEGVLTTLKEQSLGILDFSAVLTDNQFNKLHQDTLIMMNTSRRIPQKQIFSTLNDLRSAIEFK